MSFTTRNPPATCPRCHRPAESLARVHGPIGDAYELVRCQKRIAKVAKPLRLPKTPPVQHTAMAAASKAEIAGASAVSDLSAGRPHRARGPRFIAPRSRQAAMHIRLSINSLRCANAVTTQKRDPSSWARRIGSQRVMTCSAIRWTRGTLGIGRKPAAALPVM
jgi:hypothetical protein